MKHVCLTISLMMVFALTLGLFGCGDPPWVERGDAKIAMYAAMDKGAEKNAPAEFATAKAIMDKGNKQVKDRKYLEAKQTFVDARFAWERALWAVLTESERREVIDKTKKTLTSLGEGWKKFEVDAGKLKADKKAVFDADAKVFKEGLKAAKESVLVDTIGTKAKIHAELYPIYDKWDMHFRPFIPLKKNKN